MDAAEVHANASERERRARVREAESQGRAAQARAALSAANGSAAALRHRRLVELYTRAAETHRAGAELQAEHARGEL